MTTTIAGRDLTGREEQSERAERAKGHSFDEWQEKACAELRTALSCVEHGELAAAVIYAGQAEDWLKCALLRECD